MEYMERLDNIIWYSHVIDWGYPYTGSFLDNSVKFFIVEYVSEVRSYSLPLGLARHVPLIVKLIFINNSKTIVYVRIRKVV